MHGFVRLIPVLLVIVILFALLQGYSAVMYAVSGNYPFAALYAVLTIAGLAIARGLSMQRRRFKSNTR
jgi:hypothetical protein